MNLLYSLFTVIVLILLSHSPVLLHSSFTVIHCLLLLSDITLLPNINFLYIISNPDTTKQVAPQNAGLPQNEMIVPAGSLVVLPCEVQGNPPPKFL